MKSSLSSKNERQGLIHNSANVCLSSSELTAVAAMIGKIPTVDEYMEAVKGLEPMAGDIYRYLNFDQIPEYEEVAKKVIPIRAA